MTVRWERLESLSDASSWRSLVGAAGDATPFQSWAWGEFKRPYGWEPERWVARTEEGRTAACLQALKKKLPLGRMLVWVPGGPLVGYTSTRAEEFGLLVRDWIETFRKESPLTYVRFRMHLPATEPGKESLSQFLSMPRFRINSGVSILFDLELPSDQLRSAMTSKHRYYVKQAEKASLEWRSGRGGELAEDMISLYRDMIRSKGIENKSFSPEAVGEISRSFGDDALILAGYEAGSPVTACLVLLSGGNAFYLIAATNAEGRKKSAAYAMISRLFEEMRAMGVRSFDFGGIDPDSEAAAGVDHFKKGFGGRIVPYLGEWEWAPSRWIAWGANRMIRRRLSV